MVRLDHPGQPVQAVHTRHAQVKQDHVVSAPGIHHGQRFGQGRRNFGLESALAAQMRGQNFGHQLMVIRKKYSEFGFRHVLAP